MAHRAGGAAAQGCALTSFPRFVIVVAAAWTASAAGTPGVVETKSVRAPASMLPPGTGWTLTFSEECDSDGLDGEKWASENHGDYEHIASSRWRENVEFRDGVCALVTRRERRGGREWTTASIWTHQFAQQYGYFEARYRYAGAPGLNNAFWLMTDGDSEDPIHFEIDINEGHFPNRVHTSLHNHAGEHWSKGKLWRGLPPGVDLSAGFHTYGLEWTENELVWYFDGTEIRRLEHQICRLPAQIRLSTAVFAHDWAGKATAALDGKSMDVDYVRVYRRVDQRGP